MDTDQIASIGWGIIACIYGIALSIVGIVRSSSKNEK